MRFLTLQLFFLFIAFAVPSQAAMKSYKHPKSGLSINLPESWVVKAGTNSSEPDFAVANNPDAFSANPPSDSCVGTFVIGKTSDIGLSDPVEATRSFAGNVSAVSKITKRGKIKKVTLAGQPAAYLMMAGKTHGVYTVFTIVSLVSGDNLAVMVGSNMGKAEHDKTIGKIAGSMRFESAGSSNTGYTVTHVSPQETDKRMTDFLTYFKNDSDIIEVGVKKYKAAKLEDPDTIDAYNLAQPEILSKQDRKGMRCYSVKTKGGVTLRTWEICWKSGKIQTIKQTEMGFAGGGLGR